MDSLEISWSSLYKCFSTRAFIARGPAKNSLKMGVGGDDPENEARKREIGMIDSFGAVHLNREVSQLLAMVARFSFRRRKCGFSVTLGQLV